MAQNGANAAHTAWNIDEVLANLSAEELAMALQNIKPRALPHGGVLHAELGATAPRAEAPDDLMGFGELEGTPARGGATVEPSIAPIGPGGGESTARPPAPPGGWLSGCKKADVASVRAADGTSADRTMQTSAPSTPVAGGQPTIDVGAAQGVKGDIQLSVVQAGGTQATTPVTETQLRACLSTDLALLSPWAVLRNSKSL